MQYKVYTNSTDEFIDNKELRFESDNADEAEIYKIKLDMCLDDGVYSFIEEEGA